VLFLKPHTYDVNGEAAARFVAQSYGLKYMLGIY
jgi:hypothetical protein